LLVERDLNRLELRRKHARARRGCKAEAQSANRFFDGSAAAWGPIHS
jgi:hypothetical protein